MAGSMQIGNDFNKENHGTITLTIPGEAGEMLEVMRFEPLGVVFVRGVKVDDNVAVYRAFKHWLEHATASQDPR